MLENLTYQSTWSIRRWGTLRGIHHAKNHFSCPGSLTEKLACHKSPLITPTIPSSPSLSESAESVREGKKIIILLHTGWSEGWRQWQSPKSNRSQQLIEHYSQQLWVKMPHNQLTVKINNLIIPGSPLRTSLSPTVLTFKWSRHVLHV